MFSTTLLVVSLFMEEAGCVLTCWIKRKIWHLNNCSRASVQHLNPKTVFPSWRKCLECFHTFMVLWVLPCRYKHLQHKFGIGQYNLVYMLSTILLGKFLYEKEAGWMHRCIRPWNNRQTNRSGPPWYKVCPLVSILNISRNLLPGKYQ